jgi:hypothetical protein
MNKIEWALSTILTYALILTTVKVTDPELLNHIKEPQLAVATGVIIALIQVISKNFRIKNN